MANYPLTDDVYDNIERIDKQRRRMKIMVMEFFFPALLCSAMSGYFYLVYSHQKGGISDFKTAAVTLLALACMILLAIAAIKLINYVKLNNKLKSIEALEDTIYKEVLEYHAESI